MTPQLMLAGESKILSLAKKMTRPSLVRPTRQIGAENVSNLRARSAQKISKLTFCLRGRLRAELFAFGS